ncbi:MAG: hypothetical protein ACRCYY_00635 [Trueperaceae bacterium]
MKRVFIIVGAMVILLTACGTSTVSSGSVETSSLDDGGYVVLINSKFADEPEQTGGVFPSYIASTEDDLFSGPLMTIDPETLQPKVNALVDRLLLTTPTQKCEVEISEIYPETTYKDVGPSVTLSSSQGSIVAERTVDESGVSYYADTPDTLAPVYQVSVAGREGLNAAGYNGSRLRTGVIPEISAPAGMTGPGPVKLSKSAPTEVRWKPTGADAAYIQLFNIETDTFIYCVVFDTGRFTIPKNVATQYPDSGTIYVGTVNDDFFMLENRRVGHYGYSIQTNDFIAQ